MSSRIIGSTACWPFRRGILLSPGELPTRIAFLFAVLRIASKNRKAMLSGACGSLFE